MKTALNKWQYRFERSKAPVIKQLSFDFAGLKSGTTMLVSSPHEINEYIRSIPFGDTRSINQLRAELAQKHGADATCPASTSIFLRIVAEAAYAELLSGQNPDGITPFWRLVEPHSRLGQKLACGSDFLVAMREREGITH